MSGARIVEEALTWLGTPYRHQGMRRGVGCDCLGLVLGVWRGVYGAVPEWPGPYTMDWAEAAGRDDLLAAARRHCHEKQGGIEPGDLLLFRWREGLPAKHCAIALSGSRIIHAYEGRAVLISPLGSHWRRRIAGIFSFPDGA